MTGHKEPAGDTERRRQIMLEEFRRLGGMATEASEAGLDSIVEGLNQFGDRWLRTTPGWGGSGAGEVRDWLA